MADAPGQPADGMFGEVDFERGDFEVTNPFANWSIADTELHNARVTGNRDGVVLLGGPPKMERDLHSEIFDECRRRGWIAFHGSMAERTHRTAGEPDFICLCDGGKLLMVECKTARGKLSKEQQAMIAHARKLGHTIHVVRSMEEFLRLV